MCQRCVRIHKVYSRLQWAGSFIWITSKGYNKKIQVYLDLRYFYLYIFYKEIDGEALLLIQEEDLISLMNIKLGPAVKIFNYILKLKQISEQVNNMKTVDAYSIANDTIYV